MQRFTILFYFRSFVGTQRIIFSSTFQRTNSIFPLIINQHKYQRKLNFRETNRDIEVLPEAVHFDVRYRLVPFENAKFFKILRHIESLDACMKY